MLKNIKTNNENVIKKQTKDVKKEKEIRSSVSLIECGLLSAIMSITLIMTVNIFAKISDKKERYHGTFVSKKIHTIGNNKTEYMMATTQPGLTLKTEDPNIPLNALETVTYSHNSKTILSEKAE